MKKLFKDVIRGQDPARRRDAITILLGLIGIALLANAYPFGWEMPEYAAY